MYKKQRIGLCTISGGGMAAQSGRQDVDCLLNDPELQKIANESGLSVVLTCEEFAVHKIYSPE
jgi:hypothetical protein